MCIYTYTHAHTYIYAYQRSRKACRLTANLWLKSIHTMVQIILIPCLFTFPNIGPAATFLFFQMSSKNSEKALGRAYDCTPQKNFLPFEYNDSNYKHERQPARTETDNNDERKDLFNRKCGIIRWGRKRLSLVFRCWICKQRHLET